MNRWPTLPVAPRTPTKCPSALEMVSLDVDDSLTAPLWRKIGVVDCHSEDEIVALFVDLMFGCFH